MATGASTLGDVVGPNNCKEHTDQIVIMQCNTNYTGSLENFKYEFECPYELPISVS